MADKKITALTSIGAATARADLLHVIDDVGAGGTPTNKKVTVGEYQDAYAAPIAIAAPATLTAATHGGKVIVVPDGAADHVTTLPVPPRFCPAVALWRPVPALIGRASV